MLGFALKQVEKVYGSIFAILKSCCGLPSLRPWVYGTVGRSLEAEKGRKLISAHLSPKLWQSQVTLSMVPRKSLLHVSTLNLQAPTQQRRRSYPIWVDTVVTCCSTAAHKVYIASAGTAMLSNDKAWPLCCPESRPEVWSRDIHKCTSGKPKSSVWFLFQEELCYSALRLIPKWPKCIWVYKLNYELSIRQVARSVQHFISADCVEADSVPSWTQSTRFWKHHQALGSLSSEDGKLTCRSRLLQWIWRNWLLEKICHKGICSNDILALKRKEQS